MDEWWINAFNNELDLIQAKRTYPRSEAREAHLRLKIRRNRERSRNYRPLTDFRLTISLDVFEAMQPPPRALKRDRKPKLKKDGTPLNRPRMRKAVRIVETGQAFESINECAIAIGGEPGHIVKVLNGVRRSHKGYTFERVTQDG